eukprot:5625055-Pyramimonas_sp.AAC.1
MREGHGDHIPLGLAIRLEHHLFPKQAKATKSRQRGGPQHVDGVPEERPPEGGIPARSTATCRPPNRSSQGEHWRGPLGVRPRLRLQV